MAILGPTASGKSGLSIELARRFDGEVVNCDAMQVYRGLDIGTAKLTETERQGIPHHLLDRVEPGEIFSAGEFRRQAEEVLAGIRQRRRLPILVGGTGFYLRALRVGLFPGPARDEAFRQRLERVRVRRGASVLHRLLARVDPESAARIGVRDHQRVARALEVARQTGRPLSAHFGTGEAPLPGYEWLLFVLAPPRPELIRRIEWRVQAMFEAGLEAEVAGLLARGTHPTDKGMEAIGYREVCRLLAGELSREEALERIVIATRRYAKRQMTWLRRETGGVWLAGFGDDPLIREQVQLAVGDVWPPPGLSPPPAGGRADL